MYDVNLARDSLDSKVFWKIDPSSLPSVFHSMDYLSVTEPLELRPYL